MVDNSNRKSVGTVRQVVQKFEHRNSYQVDADVETKPTLYRGSMASENIYALPFPVDTPYRTPSSSRSRQTSRTYEDLSPTITPPPLSFEVGQRKHSDDSLNAALDESLPFSDPRRFTPTLHASLVSEILSLRRDAEIRTRDIEGLEHRLHDAEQQNQTLNDSILTTNRDARQLKRQMQILEGGTLSAINEISKERDDAMKDVEELRYRIEQAQKKSKNQDDSMDRVHEQWQQEAEAWSTEKRTLETKIQIAEGRLKVVLSEVVKAQQFQHYEDFHPPRRSQSRPSVAGSPRKRRDSANTRRQSVNSIISEPLGGRTSVLSFAHVDTANLADELALEDIDEDYVSQPDEAGHMTLDLFHEPAARPSSRVSLKARKVLGLPIDIDELEQVERSIAPESLLNFSGMMSPKKIYPNRNEYVDTGVQYSRPASPTTSPERSLETPTPRKRDSVQTSRASKTLSITSQVSQDSAQYSVDTSDNAWEENLRNQPIMVSASCQTEELELHTPAVVKPDFSLGTIREITETREIAVQTESFIDLVTPGPKQNHSRSDTEQTSASLDLQIPSIAIIPPTSRPVTPDSLMVKLPPRTKSIACQVETQVLVGYVSNGVQTEEIRIDKRNIVLPAPTVPPPSPPSPPPISSTVHPASNFGKTKGLLFSRRGSSTAAAPLTRRAGPTQALPPINDDGQLSGKEELRRPVRSSSMFAGFDEVDEAGGFDGDVFHDEEFFNRPMTKLVLSRGKILTASKNLDDIEESEAAVAAGKRFAMEQIRRSEENDRDVEIGKDAQIRTTSKVAKQVKREPSSRSGNIRRTALISSGTAAHQVKSSLSSQASGEIARPPMPIPVRYSSARVGKSISDGGRSSRASSNASPTRNARRLSRPSLRKSRSGPAMSPATQAARKARSRSPPLDTKVSIVPAMPNFRMPDEQKERSKLSSGYATSIGVNASLPSIAQGPTKSSPLATEDADEFVVHQTSVVDAIAQTMVGEWMFKYVRRRKSFGKPEKDWDPSKSFDEISNSASTGVRHKRWVWLAPYERSVMWSNKQPTDGISLLGKSGRKLTIKSVLDVKDDNPMPKGAVNGAQFNRSILILTPQRALKFTASTQDRHYVWLTALSFLSHSPISLSDLAPMPPMPADDPLVFNPAASLGGSLQRRPIRDSIRIAKGSNARPQFRSFTTDGIPTMSEYDRPRTQEAYDPLNDAAMPPVIRRYHNRNRSNTAPKPATNAFRALLSRDSGHAATVSSVAVISDKPVDGGSKTPRVRRGSEASTADQVVLEPALPDIPARFFEGGSNSSHAASMTMRMDAFIADQQRQVNVRGVPARGSARNLRLGRPSMRNLKDPNNASWSNYGTSLRETRSPDSSDLLTPTEVRFSESTGRDSSEMGG